MARSDFGEFNCKFDDAGTAQTGKIDFKAKWRFLLQAFAGAGVCLNENWSLTAGYRLRYLPGDCKGSKKFAHDRVTWDWKVKQNMSHAAEVGLTYQF
jgi:opacity protein-like surface antigen